MIPVLRNDRDRAEPPTGVVTPKLTSTTDGHQTAWRFTLGPPSVGGEPRETLLAALDASLLLQGIVDSITPALAEIRPHWFKLFLVKKPDGEVIGDVKIDGVPVGVAASFDGPRWPANPDGALIVRQFGIARPTPDGHRSLLGRLRSR